MSSSSRLPFATTSRRPKDLTEGMVLEGVVTNIVAFGAFVDIGVHQDGLVHVSQLADRFVRDPNEIVKVGQKVKVTVVADRSRAQPHRADDADWARGNATRCGAACEACDAGATRQAESGDTGRTKARHDRSQRHAVSVRHAASRGA